MPPGVFRRPLRNQADASSWRQRLARWLDQVIEFWNRQPHDRFWPPHP